MTIHDIPRARKTPDGSPGEDYHDGSHSRVGYCRTHHPEAFGKQRHARRGDAAGGHLGVRAGRECRHQGSRSRRQFVDRRQPQRARQRRRTPCRQRRRHGRPYPSAERGDRPGRRRRRAGRRWHPRRGRDRRDRLPPQPRERGRREEITRPGRRVDLGRGYRQASRRVDRRVDRPPARPHLAARQWPLEQHLDPRLLARLLDHAAERPRTDLDR